MNVTRPILEDINNGTFLGHFRNMQDNILTIGIHLRHQNAASLKDHSIDNTIDHTAELAIERLLNNKTSIHFTSTGKRCFLLLASDRMHTFKRFAKFAPKVGCELKHVDRNISIQANTHHEHGPWEAQIMTGSDYHLLSHADYFIGSEISTFSVLIANRIVARATERGDLNNSLLWISVDGAAFSEVTRRFGRYKVEPNACKNVDTYFNYTTSTCSK
jgi:hypothetical protein